MFRWLYDQLFGATGRAAGAVFILNHNPVASSEPGDVQLYGSLEAVCGDLHADDLRRGGYLAVDGRGHLITLLAGGAGDATVTGKVASVATHRSLAMRLLKHHLLEVAQDRPGLGIDPGQVGRSTDMAALIAMVPPRDIIG